MTVTAAEEALANKLTDAELKITELRRLLGVRDETIQKLLAQRIELEAEIVKDDAERAGVGMLPDDQPVSPAGIIERELARMEQPVPEPTHFVGLKSRLEAKADLTQPDNVHTLMFRLEREVSRLERRPNQMPPAKIDLRRLVAEGFMCGCCGSKASGSKNPGRCLACRVDLVMPEAPEGSD